MGRTQSGLAGAGVALTAAVFVQSCPVLAACFVALTVLILIGTFANRVRLLHKLPVVGAPKLEVTFRVNGSQDLIVRLRRVEKDKDHAEPRTAQIEVGVRTPAREVVDRAHVNFLLPIGLLRKRTDHDGRTWTEGGKWMPPTTDRVDGRTGRYDYWWEETDFQRWPRLFYFNATFSEPGEYSIRMRIGAPALYETDFDKDATIRVELVDDDGQVERVTDAIARGEEARKNLTEPQPDWFEPHNEAAVFYLMAHNSIPDDYPEGTELLNQGSFYEGSKVGTDYCLSLVEQNLAVLYEVRRVLGRREDQP